MSGYNCGYRECEEYAALRAEVAALRGSVRELLDGEKHLEDRAESAERDLAEARALLARRTDAIIRAVAGMKLMHHRCPCTPGDDHDHEPKCPVLSIYAIEEELEVVMGMRGPSGRKDHLADEQPEMVVEMRRRAFLAPRRDAIDKVMTKHEGTMAKLARDDAGRYGPHKFPCGQAGCPHCEPRDEARGASGEWVPYPCDCGDDSCEGLKVKWEPRAAPKCTPGCARGETENVWHSQACRDARAAPTELDES